MRSNLSLSDLCAVVVLALVVAPAAAIDCRNVPTSFGPIPPEVLAACGGRGAASRPALGSTNEAVSPEGIGATCSEMSLDDPAATTLFGSIEFRPACDFAGDDSALYCLSHTNPSTLSRVDATTCGESTVGTCVLNGGQLPSGLAWDPAGFTMFMSSTGLGTSELYQVDLTTGACTFVGDMGADAPGNIALAADCEQLYGYDIVNDSGYSISRGTGRATLLGPLGFDANFAQGMDCSPFPNDGCYLFAFNNTTFTGQLRTFDTTNGSTTLIGDIGATGFEEWTGAGIKGTVADACGGCGLNVQMPRRVGPGELVRVHLSISHRRSVPVEVPFTLEIRDRRGRVLFADQTRAYRLRYGDTVSTSHTLQMPGLGPGVYELVASMAEMRGGTEVATLPFRIR